MPGTSKWNKVELSLSSGNSGAGEFARTLNVTDIHTAWTESRAVLGRGQAGVERALNNEVEKTLPFRLLGLDSDISSKFINWHLKGLARTQTDPTDSWMTVQEDSRHLDLRVVSSGTFT